MKTNAVWSFGLFTLMTMLISCGTTNNITGTWKAPDANLRQYEKVFVAALTSDVPVRQTVERQLAGWLTDNGIGSIQSLEVLPPDFESKELEMTNVVLQKIQESGSDAIMTVALIDQTSEERYVPSGGMYQPMNRFGYYNTFGGYWGNWHGNLYQPGYYTTDKTYYIETNVYDAKSGNLVWSAQSETVNPSELDSFLEAYKSSMSKKLKQDGLLANR
ncbi:hypothetical protein M8998_06110 [Sphingobacterium sp. lm-10]|uniref:hypothetical protein n=1 Tax=Sphingobacterium sp. lm-10 TaxID=2944904 RepID=UPI0020209426|nr:hypothetical protein [Sphingobacterium sp. lm-10]MCL7987506.1 hypothetical protein [Sphingobacterium sp. lm-10]